jgi:hypothetical protein
MTAKIEKVRREVIEKKLLIALNDDAGKVALVLSEKDLNILLRALADSWNKFYREEDRQMYEDLDKLKQAAFGC